MKSPTKTLRGVTAACSAILVLAGFNSSLCSAAEREVFSDNFDTYTNQTELMSAWTKVDTSVSSPNIGKDSAVSSQFLTSPNSLISHSLGETLSASQDWILTFDMIHTAYSRGGWVGLFDATGKNGYLAMWDSGGDTGNNSTFSIRSFSSDTPITSWNAATTALPNGSFSILRTDKDSKFNSDTNNTFVTVTLAWDASDSTLTLTTNIPGSSGASVSVTGIDVSQILIRGNTTVWYDNVSVTTPIPEPATVALLVGACCLCLVGFIKQKR